MLRRVAAFCRPLRPSFLVSFSRHWGPVVCVLGVVLVVAGVVLRFCVAHSPPRFGRAVSLRGPWTVTRSPLRVLRRGAAFCRPLRPSFLVSFSRHWGPVVCVLGVVLVVAGVVLRFCVAHSPPRFGRAVSLRGPWTVTRSPLRVLRRGAAFCRPLRPSFLVSFSRHWGPVVCVLGVVLVVAGVVLRFCVAHSPPRFGRAVSLRGPWTVTRSSLRMLRRVAAFCRPLRPVLPLVSFPRSRSPVVGVLGLCWTWRDVPFARQWRPVVGVLGLVLVVAGVQGVPPPPMVHGPGQSPARPFACCVGSLRSVGRCGRCSRWCRFRVRGAQSLVCWGCAGCGGMCRLRVSGPQ